MRIGVLSDTHGSVEATRRAVRMLESLEVELVIHCGDIGSPAVVDLFGAWPTHFVFGNVDNQPALAKAISAAGQTCHERFGRLELAGKRIAFLHGDAQGLMAETIASGRWDLVCHGHTHQTNHCRQGHTVVLNPGAVDRAEQPSVAVVELPSMRVTPISLDRRAER